MAKITPLQTNFTAGEISPKLHGRGDLTRYANGVKKLRNCINLLHGGAGRRPGTRYRGATKSNGIARLIPFVLSGDACYWLEFGNTYLRVWDEDGQVLSAGVPVEITTVYTSAQVLELDYAQSGNDLILFHADVYPQRLRRTSSTSWAIGNMPFVQEPVAEVTATPAVTLAPSAKDPIGAVITLTRGSGTWAVGDVGKVVKINGGYCKITGGAGTATANATILRVLNATTTAEIDSWELHSSILNSTTGYPKTGTFFEQRLVMGGFKEATTGAVGPNTVVGSVTGNMLDFTPGNDDADSFNFVVSADQMSGIEYLTQNRILCGLSFGGEFTMQGGIEKPLTASSVQVRQRSNAGCTRVRPVRVGSEEVFVQRSGKKLYSLAYNTTNDDFTSEDISRAADHITEPVVVDLSWQQEPDRTLWLVLDDGTMAHATIERSEQVIGYGTHDFTNGIVESVATIPVTAGDMTALIVKRTINGNTVRYFETFEKGLYVDCAVTYSSGTAQTVFTGLGHLEGQEVDVVGDGIYKGRKTVTSGQVEIEVGAKEVQIGLPIDGAIELLNPDVQPGLGALTGSSMAVSETIVKVLDTVTLDINGTTARFRKLGAQVLDNGMTVYSGSLHVESLGIGYGSTSCSITYNKPFPFHVLSVVRKLTAND